MSQLLGAKAAGLAALRRLDEADHLAREAASWAPEGQESRDQALAMRVWLGYLRRVPMADDLHAAIAGQARDLGLAELCAAPGALAGAATREVRAARLVAAARQRPKLDLPSPFLLAFAWLAIEAGDLARARALVEPAEMYDSSTQVALLYALAAIEGWSGEEWDAGRGAMIARYLSPEQEQAAKLGALTLDAEVERWEHILDPRPEPVQLIAPT